MLKCVLAAQITCGVYEAKHHLFVQARHEQRMELANRASKPQEEEVAWDDADEANDDTLAEQSDDQPASTAQALTSAAKTCFATAQPAVEEQNTQTPEPTPSPAPGPDSATAPSIATAQQAADADDEEPAPRVAADEDAPDTVTNSDSGSASEHWTVVTGPGKQGNKQEVAAADTIQLSASGTAAAGSRQAAQARSKTNPGAAADDDNDEIDELDDVSNDDSPASEGEEDWGTWE